MLSFPKGKQKHIFEGKKLHKFTWEAQQEGNILLFSLYE